MELTQTVSNVDFATFVLGQEDLVASKGTLKPSPRDNVIFEAGLFSAMLGTARTFFLVDRAGTKLPSDWLGLTYVTYDSSEQRSPDKIYDAVQQIRQSVGKVGPRSQSAPLSPIVGSWWQFVMNQAEGSVLSLMKIRSEDAALSTPKIEGKAWSQDAQLLAEYGSCAAKYDAKTLKLSYYWTGKHPRQKSVPAFFGVGEIDFTAEDTPASRGKGFFSESEYSHLDGTNLRTTAYLRATGGVCQVVEKG